jgi:type IV secretory pathway VirJ component
LVGYSSGATLAYAILVQAPSGTFSGAVSLGFCPDLPLRKPLCRGSGLEATALPKGNGFSFLPTKRSDLRWTALQGDIDQVCDPRQTAEYVAQVPGARLINLPGVGHGFSRPRGYLAQLQQAVEEQKPQPIRAAPEPVKDLPIVELPAAPGSRLAIMITGDGGWTGIDKEIGETLVKDGVAVVGLNSLRYFWTRRTPDSATLDLERILRYYMADWRRDDILLIGYSFGADVLPFMVNRLPADLRQRVRRVALLGPSSYATFEFHIGDWLDKRPADALPTEPEIRALKEVPVLCVYGSDEKKPLCPRVQAGANFTAREFPGGHHFGRDYAVIAQAILGGT